MERKRFCGTCEHWELVGDHMNCRLIKNWATTHLMTCNQWRGKDAPPGMQPHVTTDRLTAFLYELLRDHVTPGALEDLMRSTDRPDVTMWTLSNGWLGEYAADVSRRLQRREGGGDVDA